VIHVAEPSAGTWIPLRKTRGAVAAIAERIEAAQSLAVLPAYTVSRFKLQRSLLALIEALGCPFAVTPMEKGVLSETHAQFAGMYMGAGSSPSVLEAIEAADLVIDAGGVNFNEINTGAYSSRLSPEKLVTIDVDHVRIGNRIFNPVQMGDLFEMLVKSVPKKFGYSAPRRQAHAKPGGKPSDPITAATLYPRYRDFFKPKDLIVLESGSSNSGTFPLLLPDGAEVQTAPLWGSIGWATGAALGAALADPSRRTILLTGEGSHQLTATAVGTMGRYGLKPIIFVLNNEGYMVERALEADPNWIYNDLAPWNYHALPAALGCQGWFTAKVSTLGELDAALARAATGESASYIEVVGGKMDFPAGLAMAHQRLDALVHIAQSLLEPDDRFAVGGESKVPGFDDAGMHRPDRDLVHFVAGDAGERIRLAIEGGGPWAGGVIRRMAPHRLD